jgi:DNA-binding XRE family transcriptional regulator
MSLIVNTMKKSRLKLTLPIPAKRALIKLGKDIRDARRRRRISTQMMAERAFISRTTLHKVEKGDAGVAMGIYATVLFILGLSGKLGDLADLQYDPVGRALEEELLPTRIRHPKRLEFKTS